MALEWVSDTERKLTHGSDDAITCPSFHKTTDTSSSSRRTLAAISCPLHPEIVQGTVRWVDDWRVSSPIMAA